MTTPSILKIDRTQSSISVPKYSEIQENFRNKIITLTWMNMDVVRQEDLRVPDYWHKVRPSFNDVAGEGASLGMPCSSIWLSNNYNIVHLPIGIDSSFVDHAKSLGLLHNYIISKYSDLLKLQFETELPVMACDEFPFGQNISMLSPMEAFYRLNRKSDLSRFSSHHAPYSIRLIDELSQSDFEGFEGERFYIKKDNTEVVGEGVFKIDTLLDFNRALKIIREERSEFPGLAHHVILQKAIAGESKSFQYYHTQSGAVQLISVSQQFVNEEGVYQGSYNPATDISLLTEAEKAMILDMSNKIRFNFPTLEGVVMNDYILNQSGAYTLDPGLRPSGNTGTSIARLFVEEQTGVNNVASYTLGMNALGRKVSFQDYFKGKEELLSLDSINKNGFTLMPWGYNPYQGLPIMALCFKQNEDLEAIKIELNKIE